MLHQTHLSLRARAQGFADHLGVRLPIFVAPMAGERPRFSSRPIQFCLFPVALFPPV
jgi:hypothetical protein